MAAANRERGRRPPVVAAKRGKKKIQKEKKKKPNGTRELWGEALERSERHRLAGEGHSSGAAEGRRCAGFARPRSGVGMRRGRSLGSDPKALASDSRFLLAPLPFKLKMQPARERQGGLEKGGKTNNNNNNKTQPQSPTKSWRSEPESREECL